MSAYLTRARSLALAMASFAAFASLSPDARACAVCSTADPTLAPVEGEAAFRGRLQATLDAREGWTEAGGVTVDDHRIDLGFRYAPAESWLVTADVPVLARRVSGPSDPETIRVVPGDAELRVDWVRTGRLQGGARQRFGVFAALKLPTAPLQTGGDGLPLSSVLQPGCGSFVPAVGADYWIGRGAFSFSATASAWLPFALRDGYHAGDSLRAGARGQWQPLRVLALRFGPSVEADTEGELGPGRGDPNSGGLLGFLAAEVVASPLPDFTLGAGGLYPVLSLLAGDHRQGPIATATLSYDF